jgi:hypothetical protein
MIGHSPSHRIRRTLAIAIILACAISILAPARASAQVVTAGVSSGQPGSNVDLTVSFTAGATGVSTLQFDLTFQEYLSASSATAVGAALAAGKSASASAVPGGSRILLFGLNQNTIGSGAVASIRLAIAPGAAVGPALVYVSNIVASDALGEYVPAEGQGGCIAVNSSPDTTPPVISKVAASILSRTSVMISWITNEASDSQVEYGKSTAYGGLTPLSGTIVFVHTETITLPEEGIYHYQVRSRDAAGNVNRSADFTFNTVVIVPEIDITPRRLPTC